jgi:hypothetical protein
MSGGGTNSLRSDNAARFFRNRLHGSATPKAKEMKKVKKFWNFIGVKRNCLAQCK